MPARRVVAKVDLRIHEAESPEAAAAAVRELIRDRLPGRDGSGHYVEDVQVTVSSADVKEDKG